MTNQAVPQTGRGTINGQWAPGDPAWDGYPPDNTVTGTATQNWVPGQGWVPAGGGAAAAPSTGLITKRADAFAAKMRPPAPAQDTRSEDQKVAAFVQQYSPPPSPVENMVAARASLKSGGKSGIIDAGDEDARYTQGSDPAIYYVKGGMSNPQTKVYSKGSVAAKWLAPQGWTEVDPSDPRLHAGNPPKGDYAN